MNANQSIQTPARPMRSTKVGRRAAWLAVVLMGFSSFADAQTISEAYRQAVQHDPVLESAHHAMEAAKEKLPQARAGLLPNVQATFGTNTQRGDVSFSDAPYLSRDARTRSWSLQLTQPLFRLANWVALDQADAQVRHAEAAYAQAQQELILRVAQAYFDVLVAEESLEVAQVQLAAVEQQLALAKRNFDVGTSTISDTYESKARLDLARSQHIGAMHVLSGKRAEYARITGEEPHALLMLDADNDLPKPDPADLSAWIATARENHPSVRLQQAVQEVAKKEIARARAAHAPTIDLTVSHGGNKAAGSLVSPADIDTRSRSNQIGIQINIPIFSGGATESRVRESVAHYHKARADVDAAGRQALMAARLAFNAFDSGKSQIAALKAAVQSSISALEASKIGYRTGTRINIDVLNAQQQLASARRDLVKARYETLMEGLKLKAAAGVLAEQDIYQIDAMMIRKIPGRIQIPGRISEH